MKNFILMLMAMFVVSVSYAANVPVDYHPGDVTTIELQETQDCIDVVTVAVEGEVWLYELCNITTSTICNDMSVETDFVNVDVAIMPYPLDKNISVDNDTGGEVLKLLGLHEENYRLKERAPIYIKSRFNKRKVE